MCVLSPEMTVSGFVKLFSSASRFFFSCASRFFEQEVEAEESSCFNSQLEA